MKMRFLDTVPYICERWMEVVAKDPTAPFIEVETFEVSLEEPTSRVSPEEESTSGVLHEETTSGVGVTLTRAQVDDLSGRVYAWLLKHGIGKEDFVMIRFPRDARPFIVMLGVWKAGAAFTVVEDNYAQERTEAIREDCKCRLVIDESVWSDILATAPQAGYREADAHDACFAIYTSGSTGKPKGVLQEYGKIKLNQASLEAHPGDLIDEMTCMAMVAPLGFIAAVKIYMNALYSGMRLVVFSTETAKNPAQMNRQFAKYGVNLAFLTPSILRVMSTGVATSLKTLVTGSEAANGVYFDRVKLINNYGMSEAGFHVAQFVVDRRYDITPIGKPVFEDIRIRLLGEDGKEVPDGEEGEICFDNPFFRGYINLPEETAKVMRDGIFHAGDVGKRMQDGNIVVTGRLNTMVKINGNRVEPGEIEACMRRIPGIRDAAVRDFRNERQQVYLCAYYTVERRGTLEVGGSSRGTLEVDSGGSGSRGTLEVDDRVGGGRGTLEVDAQFIRQKLQTMLPHYMIPAFFIQLDQMPLNRNGKVDRFALPKPDVSTMGRAYAAPETPEEMAICQAFEKVLQVERVGANDDFFELGGDSLSTALAAAELENLQVDYKDIYAWKTPREIASRLPGKKIKDLDILTQAELLREQHLTPYQTYFYDAILYSPTQTGASNPFTLRFPGESVDAGKLQTALETVFANYAVFSTVFSHNELGEPVMRYAPGRIVHPEIIRVSEHSREMLREIIGPYKLNDELMYRCRIYETPDFVYMDFDSCHLISDGTTIANFMSEVRAAYRGEALRKDHYYHYLEEQYRHRMELEHEADVQLLVKRFSHGEYLCNPKPDLDARRTGNGQYSDAISCTTAECLKACASMRTSLNKLFVAAALIALSKHSQTSHHSETSHSQTSRVSVQWTYNGRDENWKKDLVGITISAVPVAVDLKDIHTPAELLREIDMQNELGMRYAALSLGNNGVTPGEWDRMIVVFQTGFGMDDFLPQNTEVTLGYDMLNGVFTRFQIILFSNEDPEKSISYYINYDSNLYSSELISKFSEFFKEALRRMVKEDSL